jgi:transposase-like protein
MSVALRGLAVLVLKPCPGGFRDDVVRVARNREPGVCVEQIAKDFGVLPVALFRWMRQADVGGGVRVGTSRVGGVELCEARERIRLLEQENGVLCRAAAYLSQANLPGRRLYPLVSEVAGDGFPVAVACRVTPRDRGGVRWCDASSRRTGRCDR